MECKVRTAKRATQMNREGLDAEGDAEPPSRCVDAQDFRGEDGLLAPNYGQAATRLPHAAQKLASGSRAVPHFPQNPVAVESCRPQAEQ